MPTPVTAPRLRSTLALSMLLTLPVAAHAQRRAPMQATAAQTDPMASQDSVVFIETVRVRSAPSPQSLSIDEVPRGTALAIEAGSALNGPWLAVRFDERTAFVPREYVTMRMAARAPVVAEAPATSSTATPAPPPTPAPTRVAVVVAEATRPAEARETPAPARETPPAAPREAPAPVRPTPAPVERAAVVERTAQPSPAPVVRQSPTASPQPATPATTPPAAPTPVRETAPRAGSVELAGTPRNAPASAAASSPPSAPAEDASHPRSAIRSALPRSLVSVALFGSATPYTVTTTGARLIHVSGHPLLSLNLMGWGVYVAPEFGSGAGHRSAMIGGGLLRQILSTGPVHITALAGVTSYTEVPDSNYTTLFASQSINAASVGGVVSLPFIGPARLAYRGQYLRGLGNYADFHKIRHAVGLQF